MDKISDSMRNALAIMQKAVDEMLVSRARTGHKVVVCDGQGRPRRVAASYILKRDKKFCFAK